MKNKLELIDWVLLVLITMNVIKQDWHNVTILDFIYLVTSGLLVLLLAIKMFRKGE